MDSISSISNESRKERHRASSADLTHSPDPISNNTSATHVASQAENQTEDVREKAEPASVADESEPIDMRGFEAETVHARADIAYLVTHYAEESQGAYWSRCESVDTLLNDECDPIAVGDIVAIVYDNPPNGIGKVVEIRQDHVSAVRAAVVQWLYSQSEAKVGPNKLTTAEAKKWPRRMRLVSNHFDVVLRKHIFEHNRTVAVCDEDSWDTYVGKVVPIADIEAKLSSQLGQNGQA